jgi:hypothetical protein
LGSLDSLDSLDSFGSLNSLGCIHYLKLICILYWLVFTGLDSVFLRGSDFTEFEQVSNQCIHPLLNKSTFTDRESLVCKLIISFYSTWCGIYYVRIWCLKKKEKVNIYYLTSLSSLMLYFGEYLLEWHVVASNILTSHSRSLH